MFIFPQITQITQRNAASCIISQRKTGCDLCCFGVVLGVVVWVLSAIICVISGRLIRVSSVQYLLSTLACLSPADYADHAEECSKLHYFAEKDRLVVV